MESGKRKKAGHGGCTLFAADTYEKDFTPNIKT